MHLLFRLLRSRSQSTHSAEALNKMKQLCESLERDRELLHLTLENSEKVRRQQKELILLMQDRRHRGTSPRGRRSQSPAPKGAARMRRRSASPGSAFASRSPESRRRNLATSDILVNNLSSVSSSSPGPSPPPTRTRTTMKTTPATPRRASRRRLQRLPQRRGSFHRERHRPLCRPQLRRPEAKECQLAATGAASPRKLDKGGNCGMMVRYDTPPLLVKSTSYSETLLLWIEGYLGEHPEEEKKTKEKKTYI